VIAIECFCREIPHGLTQRYDIPSDAINGCILQSTKILLNTGKYLTVSLVHMHFRTIDHIAYATDDIADECNDVEHTILMSMVKNEIEQKAPDAYSAEKGMDSNLKMGSLLRANLKADATLQREVGKYIQEMAAELAELAYQNHLNALAVACDVVREIAAGNVNSHERHVDYAPTI
jgi:hypothetical protein